ncbi:Pentatricopeptide repeat-containing protein At2g31400, partial [Durusdinium trenchii]
MSKKRLREVTQRLRECQKTTSRRSWQEGLQILENAIAESVKVDVIAISILLAVAQKAAAWTAAFALLEDMLCRAISPNEVTYGTLLSACQKPMLWQETLDLLRTRSPKPRLVAFNAGLGSCRVAWSIALLMLSCGLSRRLPADIVTYNTVTSACETWPLAAKLLATATKASHGLRCTVIGHNAVIAASRESGAWREAMDRFTWMQLQGLRSSSVTLNSLGSSGALWAPALSLLGSMATTALASQEVFNAALLACSRSSTWRWTAELCDEVLRPDEVAAIALCAAQEEAGLWMDAMALLKSSIQERLVGSATLHVSVCSACTRGRRWERSMLLWEDMRTTGFWPDAAAHGALLQMLSVAGAGKWRASLGHLAGLKGFASTILGNFAMAPCEQVRQWREALWVSSSLAEAGLEVDAKTFGLALGSLQVPHQWARSLILMAELPNKRLAMNDVHLGAALATAQASQQWPVAVALLKASGEHRLRCEEPAYGAALQSTGPRWWASLALAEDMSLSLQVRSTSLPLLEVKSDALLTGRCFEGHFAVLHEADLQGLELLARETAHMAR